MKDITVKETSPLENTYSELLIDITSSWSLPTGSLSRASSHISYLSIEDLWISPFFSLSCQANTVNSKLSVITVIPPHRTIFEEVAKPNSILTTSIKVAQKLENSEI